MAARVTQVGLTRLLSLAAVLALVAAAGLTLLQDGPEQKTLTASFPRTVSLYEGSDVRILGVPVGTVDSVTPTGTDVTVTMTYDAKYKVPADAEAVIVTPAIVGDRFVQLTPVYRGGKVLADGAKLSTERTSTPLELDEIYQSIDDLMVALGPQGANSKGALSDLLDTSAGEHSWPLPTALAALEQAGRGVALLLNCGEEVSAMLPRVLHPSTPAQAAPRSQMDLRTYGVGAQILRDLGITRMKLLGSPRRMPSMTGYGLEVTGFLKSPKD